MVLPHRIILSLLLLAAFGAAPSLAAQTWLAPAFPNVAPFGPATAKGAIIWNHGRSVDTEDSEAPTPPYMALLHDDGWDTFRFNRKRVDDTLQRSAAALARIVGQLKADGYRQVALAGQSFGGFLALMAADTSDQVDAVVVTAPAAYGSFSDYYDSWRSNATQLFPLLQQVRNARVMMFFFHGDDFDPGGRGDRSREILTSRHIANIIVDQPPQLTTHWAATTPLFSRRFGGCILGFLDAAAVPSDARCERDTFWAGTGSGSNGTQGVGQAQPRPNGGG